MTTSGKTTAEYITYGITTFADVLADGKVTYAEQSLVETAIDALCEAQRATMKAELAAKRIDTGWPERRKPIYT